MAVFADGDPSTQTTIPESSAALDITFSSFHSNVVNAQAPAGRTPLDANVTPATGQP
jgi:hypothetical protein